MQACTFKHKPGKNTQFFSTYEAAFVFTKLVDYLKERKIKCTLAKNLCRLDFEAVADESADERLKERAVGRIEVQQVDETVVCVDFTKKVGSSWLFYDLFNSVVDDLAEISDAHFEPLL